MKTGSITGAVCPYQVRIRLGPNLPIKANSYVEIEIPPEITITDTSNLRGNSFTEGVEDSKALFTLKSPLVLRVNGIFNPNDL